MMKKLFRVSVLGLMLTIFLASCSSAPKIESDSIVEVEYTGYFKDGEQFDSNVGKNPLAFVMGHGQVIKGFEEQIKGLRQGATKKFTIPAKEAYGDADPAKVVTVKKDSKTFPGELVLEEGKFITATQQDPKTGKAVQFPVKVVKVGVDEVTLDYNHPLAGKDLTYDIKIVSVASTKDAKEVKIPAPASTTGAAPDQQSSADTAPKAKQS